MTNLDNTPIESTPWENMLKNVGEWDGSFTKFDLQGTELNNIPSNLKLEDLGDHRAKLTLIRRSPQHPNPLSGTVCTSLMTLASQHFWCNW